MARRSACSSESYTLQVGGRPRRYRDGWDSAYTRIYLSKETLLHWRSLRTEGLSSDNDVAVFLLERNRVLTDIQASQMMTR